MKKFVGAVLTCMVMATPIFAESHATEMAEKQCKSEYSAAKKAAEGKSTHKARHEAKKEAKMHYKDCMAKAKGK
ncbi:MAG: hypothetical protein NVSMB68_04920 [Thermoanaerobaculia bacterium]